MSIPSPELDERLAILGACDPILVDPIRTALTGMASYSAPVMDEGDVRSRIEKWLAAEPALPDAVILPCPPHGRMLDALLFALPKTCRILVAVRSSQHAARLFLETPIERYIQDDRVRLVIGENEDRLDITLMKMVDLPSCPAIRVCDIWPESPDWEFYGGLLLSIRTRVRMKVFNLATVVHLGPQWQYNTLKNLPLVCRSPGVNSLTGLFAERPALVVAAGPSLDESLPHLAEVARGFVIIAVGTALRSLRRAGIRPDLVITVDASPKTGPQFETPCDDLFLVSSMIAFPAIPPKFRGVFFGRINANTIGRWLARRGGEKGQILSAGTVTASALDLAVRMGCNPILSMGLDLCTAADGRFHVNHSMYHGQTIASPGLIPVPGNHRQTVYTTPQFYNYIEAISDYVTAQPGITFLNATHDGARIQGMDTVMPHHLRRFGRPGLNAYDAIGAAHERHRPDSDITNRVCELRDVERDLGRIHDEAMGAIRLCNRIMVSLKDPVMAGTAELNLQLEAIQSVESAILNAGECFAFIEMSLRPIHYAMGQKLKTVDDPLANAIEANRRSREFFEQVAGACLWTRQLLEDGIRRIDDTVVESFEAGQKSLSEQNKQVA